jgi:hypothetical protein
MMNRSELNEMDKIIKIKFRHYNNAQYAISTKSVRRFFIYRKRPFVVLDKAGILIHEHSRLTFYTGGLY